jgi:predicted acyl esterase
VQRTILIGACLVAARVAAAQDERPEPRFAIDVTRDVMVPMRDGVRLATDVYRPRGVTDRLPVILIRLHYVTETRWVTAANTVHEGGAFPSAVLLPVVH